MTNTAKILNFGRGNFAGQERRPLNRAQALPDITGQLLRHLNSDLMNAIFTSNAWCATSTKAEISFRIASN